MTMARTLMILGARRTQVPAIRKALEMGLRVVVVDPDPDAPGLALASARSVHDLANISALLELARTERVDGILTLAADYPMRAVAVISKALDLPGPSPATVEAATNKLVMRKALERAGIQCPRYLNVRDLDSAKSALASLASPAIFKPAMSHGGRGITRVDPRSTPALIEKAFQRALDESRAGGVMVEEFVDGPEFSVETLSYGGRTQVIAVTDKLTSGSPHYVEIGHNQPSRWPAEQLELLRTVTIQAVGALGIDQAAAHTELRLTQRGPVIMEVAARLGGGFINSHLVPLSSGVDMVAAAIQIALGDLPDTTPRETSHSAAIRFLSAPPGKVTRVDGLDESLRVEGLADLEIYVQPGDLVGVMMDARDRLGHVICYGKDVDQAVARAELARQHIRIVTDGEAGP